jgi:hypothetical protein
MIERPGLSVASKGSSVPATYAFDQGRYSQRPAHVLTRIPLRRVPRSRKGAAVTEGFHSVFYIVTGEPFKQSAELTGERVKMKD